MSLNAAGDLDRFAYKIFARARCAGGCSFRVNGLSSGATGAKARAHTRETGHKTLVTHDHITEYRKPGKGGGT